MKKSALILSFAVIFVLLAVGGFGAFLTWQFLAIPQQIGEQEIIYEVVPGKSFAAVANDLQMKGIIKNAWAFQIYAKITHQRNNLKAGQYGFHGEMTAQEVLSVLSSGKSIAKPFTVAEGLNLFEIADLLESQGFGSKREFLKIVFDPQFASAQMGEKIKSLEGYLYPETYQVTKFMKEKEIVIAMVRQFQSVWRQIEGQLKMPPNWGRHQLVTFASLIEKETGSNHERALISSVFHNRIQKHMRLQTDPTVLYGLALQTGVMPKNITRADLVRPTEYNTYVISQMPPGPISNMGKDSLLAAAAPAVSNYLYFVSQNNGTHIFSESYEDHNRAVQKFQLNAKAREGKSWRQLDQTQRQRNGTASP